MSTVKDLADAEALRAEAGDESDELEHDELEGKVDEQPEPEQEPGEPTAEQLSILDEQIRGHLERVRNIMRVHVEGFGVCDTCGAMGLVPPTPAPVHFADFKECDTCNGYGEVLTGARNPDNASVKCPRCGGRGFLERAKQIAAPATAAIAGEEQTPAAPDEWGTPTWMGDPSIRPGA